MNNNIKVFDKALNVLDVKIIRQEILLTPLLWADSDRKDTNINTLITRFPFEDKLTQKFHKIVTSFVPDLEYHKFGRCQINVVMPQTNPPYFHTDGDNIISCIFYLNPHFDIDEGGETQFDIDDQIYGVKSKPGRLCIFDGSLLHRMTFFRKEVRVIASLKYVKNEKFNIFGPIA